MKKCQKIGSSILVPTIGIHTPASECPTFFLLCVCVFHHLSKIGFNRRCTIATTNSFIDSLRLPTYTEADCTYMMHGVSDVYSSTCTEDDGKMGKYTLMGGLVKTGDKR